MYYNMDYFKIKLIHAFYDKFSIYAFFLKYMQSKTLNLHHSFSFSLETKNTQNFRLRRAKIIFLTWK